MSQPEVEQPARMGSSDDVALRNFLAERDAPCPNCGYNLRGLQAETCPECKHVLRLQFARVERPTRRRFWLTLAVACVGLASGLTDTVQTVFNLVRGQVGIDSIWLAVLMGIWFLMELWLIVLCGFGLFGILHTRGSDRSQPAIDRLTVRLLLYLLTLFAVSLMSRAAAYLGLL